MVKKTYVLKAPDAAKLASYASRYRAIRTSIDEEHGTLTVWTTFFGNPEPTSIADSFTLEVVSEAAPQMPEDEISSPGRG